ncbi:hypothetical protein BZA77DRAFT_292299 [Pyronema omphalodes]|nr:hypothetical protein BZA77DRAFT_298206 [Pyronema omphalodes]KAI5817410.1 hypothetical protein BZA77DRAFT_292299 [Pyronema omphalodes]
MSDGTRRKRDRLMARLRHLWKSWKARKHKASRGRIEKRTGNPQTNISTAIPSNPLLLTHIHRTDTPSAHLVTTIESSSEIQAEGTIYNEGVQSDSIISSQQNPVTATEHTADTPVQEQGERTDDSTTASVTISQSLWSKAFYHEDLDGQRTTLEDIGFQANALECVSAARGYVEDILKERKAKAWKIDKLLNWIDKFKEIGDIVVQYDPAHAALPWAAFRLLLNICVARHTTREAIVDGLEYIASLIQRCTIYEIIYHNENSNASTNLRESILQLYIAVLKFFAKAIDKAKENHFEAVFTTENISDYLGNIKRLEKTVKDDADVVGTQATRDDFKRLRAQLKNMNHMTYRIHDWIADRDRSSTLRWISSIPYISHHKRISEGRLDGTAEWLFERQEYEDWMSSSESKLLLLRGIPGAGKTYMA